MAAGRAATHTATAMRTAPRGRTAAAVAFGGIVALSLAASANPAAPWWLPAPAGCVGHDVDAEEDKHKHAVATKTWKYYSGPGGELSNMRLFSGNSNPELAKEIAQYLGIELSSATVGHFIDGETKIQVNENVRQTHCFVVQPVSSPVNDSLMELLLLISTLRRASAAEITAVIPY